MFCQDMIMIALTLFESLVYLFLLHDMDSYFESIFDSFLSFLLIVLLDYATLMCTRLVIKATQFIITKVSKSHQSPRKVYAPTSKALLSFSTIFVTDLTRPFPSLDDTLVVDSAFLLSPPGNPPQGQSIIPKSVLAGSVRGNIPNMIVPNVDTVAVGKDHVAARIALDSKLAISKDVEDTDNGNVMKALNYKLNTTVATKPAFSLILKKALNLATLQAEKMRPKLTLAHSKHQSLKVAMVSSPKLTQPLSKLFVHNAPLSDLLFRIPICIGKKEVTFDPETFSSFAIPAHLTHITSFMVTVDYPTALNQLNHPVASLNQGPQAQTRLISFADLALSQGRENTVFNSNAVAISTLNQSHETQDDGLTILADVTLTQGHLSKENPLSTEASDALCCTSSNSGMTLRTLPSRVTKVAACEKMQTYAKKGKRDSKSRNVAPKEDAAKLAAGKILMTLAHSKTGDVDQGQPKGNKQVETARKEEENAAIILNTMQVSSVEQLGHGTSIKITEALSCSGVQISQSRQSKPGQQGVDQTANVNALAGDSSTHCLSKKTRVSKLGSSMKKKIATKTLARCTDSVTLASETCHVAPAAQLDAKVRSKSRRRIQKATEPAESNSTLTFKIQSQSINAEQTETTAAIEEEKAAAILSMTNPSPPAYRIQCQNQLVSVDSFDVLKANDSSSLLRTDTTESYILKGVSMGKLESEKEKRSWVGKDSHVRAVSAGKKTKPTLNRATLTDVTSTLKAVTDSSKKYRGPFKGKVNKSTSIVDLAASSHGTVLKASAADLELRTSIGKDEAANRTVKPTNSYNLRARTGSFAKPKPQWNSSTRL